MLPLTVAEVTPDDIKALRKELNLSQFAFCLKLGVSLSSVSRWEQGRVAPSALALKKIRQLQAQVKARRQKH
ncbi:MAG: helix-turn-helix domain-containing protein [Sphaerochaeta sp.]|jgi:putative transcriptional regulator|nr:helix-turn-helix domain-containing protein [Sphaerochaeta sp.]